MKWRVLTAVVLILALLVGGVMFRRAVSDTCRQVGTILQQAGADMQPGTMEAARELWEGRLPLLSCVVAHDRLERVGEGLARANGYLQAGARGAFRGQIEGVLYLLEDIREYDDITVQTLL